jgi:hypothetical protein
MPLRLDGPRTRCVYTDQSSRVIVQREKCRNVRASVAIGGKPDVLCSMTALLPPFLAAGIDIKTDTSVI